MNSLTDAQKGYLAGILDGEGCFSIRHQNSQRSFYATVQVANTDLRMVTYLMEVTGVGLLCSYPMLGNRKQAYKWTVTRSVDVYAILDAVMPYLITKYERGNLLYRLREIKSRGFVRKGVSRGKLILSDSAVADCRVLFEKMRELNFRGLREAGGELLGSPERVISSQGEAGMPRKVQRLGAETRTVGNAPTSALP